MISMYDKLMSHDVTVEKLEQDFEGGLSVTQSKDEKGFVEYGFRRSVNEKGEQVEARATVYLKSDTILDPSHRQWQIVDKKHNLTLTVHEPQIIDDPRTGKTHHIEVTVI